MSWYRLFFGGMQIGDEVVLTEGSWEAKNPSRSPEGLEEIVSVDNSPICVAIYPRFRVRKKTDSFLEFERWVFDMIYWADGGRRTLYLVDDQDTILVNFGDCKLIKLERPKEENLYSARWSDSVILTFQSDTVPIFY